MHYIAMAGLCGCLPNVCESHNSREEAVESMSSLHELGQKRTASLHKSGYIDLSIHRDGNEYIEISECDCDDPGSHNDF